MNTNDKAFDMTVSHAIGLQRYGSGVVSRTLALLLEVEKDIVARLAVATDLGRGQLEGYLGYLRTRIDRYRMDLRGQLEPDLIELANYEAEYQAQKLSGISGAAFNRPTQPQLVAAATSRPFQGRLLSEWIADLPESTFKQVRDAVRIGAVEGQSIDGIVKRIRGTRANGFKDGIMQTTRRNTEALVRTAVNHTANAAREQVYVQNEGLMDGVMWVSVLDGRTTPICQSRDGEVYKPNSGPRPPAHINCRSTTAPVFSGVPSPKRLNYSEWLRQQPKAEVTEILGPARTKLFNAGMDVDRFVDASGHKYTIDQLRARDKALFDRLGI